MTADRVDGVASMGNIHGFSTFISFTIDCLQRIRRAIGEEG
ncbi:MAG: hypothetical protein ACK5R2_11295 [Cyanobacteriota bacterium]